MPVLIYKAFSLPVVKYIPPASSCPMCMGAIYWARPKKVYFGATRHDAAAAGFDDSLIYKELTAPCTTALLKWLIWEVKRL